MDLIQIKGGNFLEGEISISGSKNASLPMIIASLLTRDKVKIRNIPNLSDVSTLLKLIKSLGSEFELKNEDNSSYKLIEASDLIITSGSTIGLESIYLGKPSITIAECYYDSIIPDAKLCQCPDKFKELLISKEIFNKTNKNQVNIYGAWAMGYFPEYTHLIPAHKISALYGRMKDGTRIASPGLAQKLIHQAKKLLKK